jgi:hypothetical protein
MFEMREASGCNSNQLNNRTAAALNLMLLLSQQKLLQLDLYSKASVDGRTTPIPKSGERR